MSYSTNPHAPKARGNAIKALIIERKAVNAIVKQFGVNRTTIWRWKKKWEKQNSTVQFTNDNRPSIPVGLDFRFQDVRWNIPTITSAPHTHPSRISETVIQRILAIRKSHNRCAEVIQHQLTQEGIVVGLTSIKRILDKNHCINHWSKWKKRRINTPRPIANAPGELVEVDTVHYVDQITGKRAYITTVIDLYSRMAYARPSYKLLPGEATKAILEARQKFGFEFQTIQSDNGPEFSSYFTTVLEKHSIRHRHTRVHKPNDNAHIERFNRTLRDECIGYHKSRSLTLPLLVTKLNNYLDYYNHNRLHLGLQCKTPIQMLQR